jgi:HEXXH motif-containing protein
MDFTFEDQIAAGRSAFIERARLSFSRESPLCCAMLDRAERAAAYLEPFAHACFHVQAGFPLEQFLVGYLPPPLRPARVAVRTDEQGAAYVPELGIYRTQRPHAQLELRCDGRDPRRAPPLAAEGEDIPFAFEAVGGGPLPCVVYPDRHPLFAPLFERHSRYADTEVRETTTHHAPTLARAFALLRAVDPACHELLGGVCKLAVLLRNPAVYSFASEQILGGVFLSLPSHASVVALAEDLVHQAAHNAFFFIVDRPRRLFAIPPRTPLATVTGEADDRSVHDALHGLYTLAKIDAFFARCLAAGALSAGERHELMGRFLLTLQRYRRSVELMSDERFYTPAGLEIFRALRASYERLEAAHRAELARYDVADQPYVFDYERFCRRNPPGGA